MHVFILAFRYNTLKAQFDQTFNDNGACIIESVKQCNGDRQTSSLNHDTVEEYGGQPM